jgi:AcrR family transcriptional regulator
MRRHDLQAQKIKDHIFQTAIALFRENGYKNTTLQDVAAAANVAVSTLFKYYPAKSDLILQTGKTATAHLRKFAADLPDTMLTKEKILAVMMEDVKKSGEILIGAQTSTTENDYPEIMHIWRSTLYKNEKHMQIENESKQGLARIYKALLDDDQERGLLSADVDTETLAWIIVAVYFFEVDWGLMDKQTSCSERISKKLDTLFDPFARQNDHLTIMFSAAGERKLL